LNCFSLRFDVDQITFWAARFNNNTSGDARLAKILAPEIRARGYLTKTDLIEFCRWKSPRTHKHVINNDEGFVHAVTEVALSTSNEQMRIGVLTLLHGVSWPTASTILHYCHPDPYPILDYRALWSLSVDAPNHCDFGLWWAYTQFCRELSDLSGESMRTVDRALWQFSKEHQGK